MLFELLVVELLTFHDVEGKKLLSEKVGMKGKLAELGAEIISLYKKIINLLEGSQQKA